MTSLLVIAGAGVLVGVLWMDLMFDVQALGHAGALPEPVLASIAGYYRRVTTEAWPMGALIGASMAVAAGSAAWQLVRQPSWAHAAVLMLVCIPVALAARRVLPHAVRLAQRHDSPAEQSRLARAICHDHLACLAMMLAVLALQLRGAG
jgi:hypothetical protein